MNEILENQLYDKFVFMRTYSLWDGEFLNDPIYCGCGDGWYQLIHDLCQEITDLYKDKNADITKLRVHQVKQKYGGLRFYVGSYIDGVMDIINKYEHLSYEVCEVCGEPGTVQDDRRWIETLCKEHAISKT